MVLEQFDKNHINEISLDQLDEAVEYVHGLILTFDKVQQHSPVDIGAIQNCHGVLQYRLIEYHEQLEKEVKRLGGIVPKEQLPLIMQNAMDRLVK